MLTYRSRYFSKFGDFLKFFCGFQTFLMYFISYNVQSQSLRCLMRYMVTGKILKLFTKLFPRYLILNSAIFLRFFLCCLQSQILFACGLQLVSGKNAKVFAKFYFQYFNTKLGELLDFSAGFQCIVHDLFHLASTAKLCSL